jgi:hypothetical protein
MGKVKVPLGGLRAVAAVAADVGVVWTVAVAAHAVVAHVIGGEVASLVDEVIVATRLDRGHLARLAVVHWLGVVSGIVAIGHVIAIRYVVHVGGDESLVDNELKKRSQAALWGVLWWGRGG